MELTGAQIFVETLAEQGVELLFGYPGGTVLNLYDALYQNADRIQCVLTADECGAAHAADGYARSSGRTGVVLATSGPGATNLVTGLATAYMDSIPLVAFTGNVSTQVLGLDGFQEAYIEGIAMPVTKHSVTVRRVEDLADTIRAAFRIAQSGRKGPVLVDIPKDLTTQCCQFLPGSPAVPEMAPAPDAAAVDRAAELLNKAERPLVYFGGGVISAGASPLLRQLVEKAGIPAVHTLMAAGALRWDDPMNLGMLGMHGRYSANRAVEEADVLLCVGARFSDRVALRPEGFARRAKVIQIDIDESEIGKNVPADLSVTGDAAAVLEALIPRLRPADRTVWLSDIRSWQERDYRPREDGAHLQPHQILRDICSLAGPETTYVTDVGQHQMWSAQYLRHTAPRQFLTSGGLGTMGFGYGAAIGAQLALGRQRRVVMLTGDGSFHMNLNEACTAVSYGLPIITVIFNNQVLGMVRQWQTLFYEHRYAATDPCRVTDFAKVAEGFGLKGWRCETPQQFREAFQKALKESGPVWIDCAIGKDEVVLPMIPGGGGLEDIIME
ncbi:biosynthetic-type acetolactate synthase large subunit [uncultured Oscillibacter sp.]|uniref:biosynthetic-type acetolactate synthase large subunit n=1 Tax=uncultured Oscillibacter sp. TaxID=876091 RepID=UPI0025DB03A2|nr:biosynthetic-type acetolactate synthase large subunit [uncultured Oscillibacter sp.]